MERSYHTCALLPIACRWITLTPMSRATIDQICARFPGATRAHASDGELPSWKVGGKMFASLSHDTPGVSVKTADIETAAMLIDVGAAQRAPYFHKSWVRIADDLPEDELHSRLRTSYDLIAAKLSKKLRDALLSG